MKKVLLSLTALAFLAACQSAPEGETAQTGDTQAVANAAGTVYNLDVATSTVGFLGTKPVGTHAGEFKLTQGSLTIDNGNITAGNFTIDVKSLAIKDADTTGSYNLVGHLLSPDFFDAAKFGTASFAVTACEALTGDSTATHKISGNLTLKDSTKNVSFPAKVTLSDSTVSATASFNIDRTQWGLFYGNDKSLGDKFIYPEVKITLNIAGKK
jgi:polyisoprenoid-binding protein YceI